MIIPPKNNPTPDLQRKAQETWGSGLVTSSGQNSVPLSGLWVADNVVINQAGNINSRDNFRKGAIPDIPTGSIFRGPMFSYWDASLEQFNVLCVIDSKLSLFVPDSDVWETVSEPDGEVFIANKQLISYAQYGGLIVIADGVNAIAYYDTENLSVSRPGEWLDENPALAVSGGAAEGDYRAYYVVSYVNDWGETPASGGGDFANSAAVATVTLEDENQPLGRWTTPLTISISGIDVAASHNCRVRIYRVTTPDFLQPAVTTYQLVKEFLAADGATATFTDDGSIVGRVIAPQLENSTGGLSARLVTELDGRIWAFGTGKEYQKIYYTGSAPTDSRYPQFFSGDGGYFYVAYGSSYEPITIKRGRADDGQICNFVLCSGPDGSGRRFNVFSLATTYGNQQIHQFYPSEQKGDEGAYSQFGVLDYMNSILYPSPGGFKSSGVRATYTGDNVTASIDANIRDYVVNIPYPVFKSMYGTIYNGRAIWSTSPSTVVVFDARNNGAWTTWTMAHDWFGSLSVGSDRIALYLVSGNRVLRYTDVTEFKRPDEAPIVEPVRIASGRIVANPEDGRQWIRLLHTLFIFTEVYGPIKITVRANSRKGIETYTGEVVVDMDKFGSGTKLLTAGEPVQYSDKDKKEERGEWSSPTSWSSGPLHITKEPSSGLVEVRVRVNKDVNFWEWEIESLPGFISMSMNEFVAEFVNIGVGLDFSSRYNEMRMQARRS